MILRLSGWRTLCLLHWLCRKRPVITTFSASSRFRRHLATRWIRADSHQNILPVFCCKVLIRCLGYSYIYNVSAITPVVAIQGDTALVARPNHIRTNATSSTLESKAFEIKLTNCVVKSVLCSTKHVVIMDILPFSAPRQLLFARGTVLSKAPTSPL